MKSIGTPPLRSAETDRRLREVYGVREEAKHKPPTPLADGYGPTWPRVGFRQRGAGWPLLRHLRSVLYIARGK